MIKTNQFGAPIIILENQETVQQFNGKEALEKNIASVKEIASLIKTSFGPSGMDKLIVDQDQSITLTNDGSTILSKSDLKSPMGVLLENLSNSQDSTSGDGTTGIVLLCSSILQNSLPLIKNGLNPSRIEKIFGKCADICSKAIDENNLIELNDEIIMKAVSTSLNSKGAKKIKGNISLTAIESIRSLLDSSLRTNKRAEVNLSLLKIEKRVSKSGLMNSSLIKGLILPKELYNPLMKKVLKNPKIAILTCPLEPPKPKTKHSLNIQKSSDFEAISNYEKNYFLKIMNSLKKANVSMVFCQWGFDEEAGYLLAKNGISAVTWIGGSDIEMLSLATGAEIIARIEDIEESKMGTCGLIEETDFSSFSHNSANYNNNNNNNKREREEKEERETLGEIRLTKMKENQKVLLVQNCPNNNTITVLLTAASKTILDELKRSFWDAIGVAKCLLMSGQNGKVVCGGGAVEIDCARTIFEEAEKCKGIEKEVMRSFGEALYEIPKVLAKNSELAEEIELQNLIALNKRKGKGIFGVDCGGLEDNNMMEKGVFEPAESKRNQILMACEIARMVLKIDDVLNI